MNDEHVDILAALNSINRASARINASLQRCGQRPDGFDLDTVGCLLPRHHRGEHLTQTKSLRQEVRWRDTRCSHRAEPLSADLWSFYKEER